MSTVQDFIAAAKARALSDEVILGLLSAAGWSPRVAQREITQYYSSTIGLSVPGWEGPKESDPLDGFLYCLALVTLIAWVTSAIFLGNGLIDRYFAAGDNGGWRGDSDSVVWLLANILVNAPLYLWVMRTLAHRLRAGVTSYASSVRLWVLSATLLLSTGVVLGDIVVALAHVLGGQPLMASLLKYLYAGLVLGGVALFYWRELNAGPKEGAI